MSQRRTFSAPQRRYAAQSQQPRKLMLALGLLVVALVAVLVKDRQFWFGTEQATIESDMPLAQPAAQPVAQQTPAAASQPVAAPRKQVAPARVATQEKPAEAPVVAVNRTVLPPLDVEVVAGDAHRAGRLPSSTPKVEVPNPPVAAPAQAAATLAAPTNAAEREPVVAAAIHAPQAAVNANYPILASHMNVQGSVVLQAIISADGMIEDLRVLSGPSILSLAAQQAVREWRFKPIFQNGQAVESKAKITVNFSIRVADSSAMTTVAESRTPRNPVVTR